MVGLRVIVLAGGKGRRLWPLSVEGMAKPFCKVFSEKTLIEETVNRMRGLGEVVILGERQHVDLARGIFGAGVSYLEEKEGLDTGNAVFFAAQQFADEDLLLFVPSDHYIKDVAPLYEQVHEAMEYARQGKIIAFGVSPRSPETRFGYIERGENSSIRAFYEKPSKERAVEFLKNREIYWNTGIYLAKVKTLIQESEKYGVIAGVSFDKGVMENTEQGLIFPVVIDWDDLGTWNVAIDYLSHMQPKGATITLKESENTRVYSEEIDVKVLGLQDAIIILTPHGLLICHKDRIGEIKDL